MSSYHMQLDQVKSTIWRIIVFGWGRIMIRSFSRNSYDKGPRTQKHEKLMKWKFGLRVTNERQKNMTLVPQEHCEVLTYSKVLERVFSATHFTAIEQSEETLLGKWTLTRGVSIQPRVECDAAFLLSSFSLKCFVVFSCEDSSVTPSIDCRNS